MEISLLNQCILSVNCPQAVGYSYVQNFAKTLFLHRDSLNINNIVVIWNIECSFSEKRSLCFFSNEQIINLEGFDITALSSRDTFITSEQVEFENYRDPNFLASSHIIAIPINHFCQLNDDYLIKNGVVLLLSQTSKIDISGDELSLLHTLLNSKIPSDFSSKSYQEAVSILGVRECCESFAPQYFYSIGKSLDIISNKTEANLSKSGLRHFSLWNVNEDTIELSKEFNRNTFNDKAHSNTTTSISCDTKHFLRDVLKKTGVDFPEGAKILQLFSFSQIKQTLKDNSYFYDIGLTDETCTLIVVSFRHQEEKKIACLYVHNLPYSVFVSSKLVCSYVKSLCEYIYTENAYSQNHLFKQLIKCAFECRTEAAFYEKATYILKCVNEATDCLIYMSNERGDLLLKSEQGDSNFNSSVQSSLFSFVLPNRFLKDERFCKWFTDTLLGPHTQAYYEYKVDNAIVHTALLVPVGYSEGKSIGYVLLINKKHTPTSDCVFYNNRFIKDNYLLTNICGMVFSQYQQLCNSIGNRNYILRKLRHEIPSITDAIQNGVDDIINGMQEAPIKVNYLMTIANIIGLNNSRIMLLSDFFTTVDFPLEKFAEEKIKVNLNRFLTSYIEIFRAEGRYRGVDVYFKLDDPDRFIIVSNYYQLAIINIVINAIRYAAVGTSVVIEVAENCIVVSDIGIPILDNEKELIYEEGYRSKNARRVNEKGMGYGLYLSKKILEAHGSSISSECKLCSEENVFAQKLVYDYIQSLPTQSERSTFIHNGLYPNEYYQSDRLFTSISSVSISNSFKKYTNIRPVLIQEWMKYNVDYDYVFIDMEDVVFKEEVYEVIFKITI